MATDTTGSRAIWASFLGSAMIFKNDSVWLASLTENQNPTELTRKSPKKQNLHKERGFMMTCEERGICPRTCYPQNHSGHDWQNPI